MAGQTPLFVECRSSRSAVINAVANNGLGRIVRFCKAHDKLDRGTIHGSRVREVLTHIGKGVLLLVFLQRPTQTKLGRRGHHLVWWQWFKGIERRQIERSHELFAAFILELGM